MYFINGTAKTSFEPKPDKTIDFMTKRGQETNFACSKPSQTPQI